MSQQSTIALATLLGLATGIALTAVLLPLWQQVYGLAWRTTRAELTRLRLAPHWARGGLLSSAQEPWRPCCTSLAVAALGASDLAQLESLITVRLAGSEDAQIQNIWTQARAELHAARDASDATVPNSDDWPHDALKARIASLLDDAERGALQIVQARGGGRCGFSAAHLPPQK
jgi:hypothetical protein